MLKYTVQAYNQTPNVGPVNEINVVVLASSEQEALQRAKTIAQRTNYAVVEIEDLEQPVPGEPPRRIGDRFRKNR